MGIAAEKSGSQSNVNEAAEIFLVRFKASLLPIS